MSGGGILGLPTFAPTVDDALVRTDDATGTKVQGSAAASPFPTLTDAGKLTIPQPAGQVVIGGTAATVVAATITLSPHLVLYQASGTDPTMGMIRDGGVASAGPGLNFFRLRSAGAVAAADVVAVLTASGHDGTDQANAGAFEFFIDASKYDGTAMTGPAANNMPGAARIQLSPDGTQLPTAVITFKNDKEVRLAATAFITIPNTGLKLGDTDASHHLTIAPGSNLTAHRTLTIVTGDANKTLTLPLPLTELAAQAANTVLVEQTGSSAPPTALAMGASTFLARLAAGNIVAATVAEAKTLLAIPFALLIVGGTNTGTVTTGTPFYPTGGGATASVGVIVGKAVTLTRMAVNFATAIATVSGSVTVRFTLFKNANSGTSNRIFQVTFTTVTTGTGRVGETTAVVDSPGTMEVLNGTTDYLVVAVEVTASTSCSLTQVDVLLEGTYN